MAWSRFVANGGEDAMEAMREHVVGEEQFLERKGCEVWLGREGNQRLFETISAAVSRGDSDTSRQLLLDEQARLALLFGDSFAEVPRDMKSVERDRVRANIRHLQTFVGPQ